MNTIKENVTFKQEIDKSIFITELIKIKNVSDIKEKINEIKEKYKDATHYCYAYIVDDNKKSSDDGEPGGTAGVPMMEVLLKKELNYILCVVIRYFGGIKLGSGGLVRAYSSSVSNAIQNDNIVSLSDGYRIFFKIDYKDQKQIEYIIKDNKYKKTYDEYVNYEVLIKEKDIHILDELKLKYDIISKEKIED